VIRTKHQVKVGERMGITTIGVGIKHDVSNVYSKAIEVNKLEDLGTATFKQIKLAV
jgi:cobalamin biosynthesis protein CobT